MVYPWIYLDIPCFLKPDFSAGLCCWTHAMRTHLLLFKSVLLHAPPWQLCQGKRWSTKGSLLLLPGQTRPLPFAFEAASLAVAASSSPSPDPSSSSSSSSSSSPSPSPPPLPPQSPSPPPEPPPPPPSAAEAVAAQASSLALSRSRHSCLLSDGADGEVPSGLVRSVTYSMGSCLRSECHSGSDMSLRIRKSE